MHSRIALSTRSTLSIVALVSAASALLHGCADVPVSEAELAGSAPTSALASESSATPSFDAQIQALLVEHPDAVQIDERSIGWDDGKVMLVLPDPEESLAPAQTDDAAAAVESLNPALYGPVRGCPSGWYCVYQHADFGGRRLQFSDCTRNDLGDYGFRDQTTAWVNNGSRTIEVMNDLNNAVDKVLWTMRPNTSSSNVGAAANDRADYFRCR
ncbi:MAG: peptidase inhibitor family I36 protein [Polyangiales bacterium]